MGGRWWWLWSVRFEWWVVVVVRILQVRCGRGRWNARSLFLDGDRLCQRAAVELRDFVLGFCCQTLAKEFLWVVRLQRKIAAQGSALGSLPQP